MKTFETEILENLSNQRWIDGTKIENVDFDIDDVTTFDMDVVVDLKTLVNNILESNNVKIEFRKNTIFIKCDGLDDDGEFDENNVGCDLLTVFEYDSKTSTLTVHPFRIDPYEWLNDTIENWGVESLEQTFDQIFDENRYNGIEIKRLINSDGQTVDRDILSHDYDNELDLNDNENYFIVGDGNIIVIPIEHDDQTDTNELCVVMSIDQNDGEFVYDDKWTTDFDSIVKQTNEYRTMKLKMIENGFDPHSTVRIGIGHCDGNPYFQYWENLSQICKRTDIENPLQYWKPFVERNFVKSFPIDHEILEQLVDEFANELDIVKFCQTNEIQRCGFDFWCKMWSKHFDPMFEQHDLFNGMIVDIQTITEMSLIGIAITNGFTVNENDNEYYFDVVEFCEKLKTDIEKLLKN